MSASPKVEGKSLLDYLGCRISVTLDDRSTLVGRLASVSPEGNMILTDPERTRPLKRQRGDAGGTPRTAHICLSGAVFVRASCVVGVSYAAGITTDTKVIDSHSATKLREVSRTVRAANMKPSSSAAS